jgi:hypothetical protein
VAAPPAPPPLVVEPPAPVLPPAPVVVVVVVEAVVVVGFPPEPDAVVVVPVPVVVVVLVDPPEPGPLGLGPSWEPQLAPPTAMAAKSRIVFVRFISQNLLGGDMRSERAVSSDGSSSYYSRIG